MDLCDNCKDKVCFNTKRPCKELENILRSEGIHSLGWIRPSLPKKYRRLNSRIRELPVKEHYPAKNNS